MRKVLLLLVVGLLVSAGSFAQQTGSISGRVTLADGSGVPGVEVRASGNVLPQARTASTDSNGNYRLVLLPPGNYELSFTLEGMATASRRLVVRLNENSRVDVTMGPEVIAEAIEVVSDSIISFTSTEIKTAIENEVIDALPVGQEYRDLQKLIPGVQYVEYSVRGPSAGGSGQDNVYLFDGVNVNLPLFGTLSAEPSSHDIDQVSVVKGGAKAVDFNRSAGFTINTVSKSGTNQLRGEVSYQIQTDSMTGDLDAASTSQFEQDQDWLTFGLGGPLLRDKLFFYSSYYRPTIDRNNRANAYGEVPDFKSERDELFGRLSFQPTGRVLIHGSYRDSDRESDNASVGGFSAASTSEGDAATLKIGILEGTVMLTSNSFAAFKISDFENETFSGPDNLLGFSPAGDGSVPLNVGALDTQGNFRVPTPIAGEDAYNAFIQPLIDRYGFLENGVRMGGGDVGAGSFINGQDFFRQSYQLGWDKTFGSGNVTHDLHIGYQWFKEEEDLDRRSNGWGTISVPGGRVSTDGGTPIFYEAVLLQAGVTGLPGGTVPVIHSEFESQNLEINDTIRFGDWSFNVGFVLSNDELFGQGLRANPSNVSGFEICETCKYKMYEIDFDDQIQPRLGAVWSYNQRDTVFASFARYHPAASSLPRAASWARNLGNRILEAAFDASGNLIQLEARGSSSGKFFVPNMNPRATDEYIVGSSRQFSPRLAGRVTARHRRSYNFWEDTNNNARLFGNAPANIPPELYIPQLDSFRAEVGGSSYVIAELDGGFTKYYEVATEADWRGDKTFVRGSYVWSHYYGNFDQDNTSTSFDFATFIGSSNIADGPGRQLWDMKYGNLNGDRRHQLKLYGYRQLPWNATAGAFAVYQSGQPWEAWDVEVYRAFTRSSSDTIRFAEPAGSRRTSAHYQLDLNYTHNFDIGDRFEVVLRVDLFNAFDRQTGYHPQQRIRRAGFGEPQAFYRPRRFQVAAKLRF